MAQLPDGTPNWIVVTPMIGNFSEVETKLLTNAIYVVNLLKKS